ncbi:TIGR00341 family protein [Rubrivirga sp. IMCC43871]|uniref:TIGR00341 family protein n=1 Tax=Rubrivirga sp. IMCC43871 TaxID=3391575 RepID=UPI00398FF718
MSNRLLIVDSADDARARHALDGLATHVWPGPDDPRSTVTAVVRGSEVEAALAALDRDDVTVAVLTVEAVARPTGWVRPSRPPTALETFVTRDRLSTEELREDVEEGTVLTRSFLAMAVASAIIAALGMRSGQTAVVIGAMVIAPLLGPCMALAMGATIGDVGLGRRAGLALAAGSGAAFFATLGLGLTIEVDPTVPELAARAVARPADIALALASGAAGVLAFSRGLSASLVGVMIAVALVPPLAAAGLFCGAALTGQGGGALAVGALVLFATNLVCINVAGIATFLLQGLPPREWRLTGRVLVLWTALLAALAALLVAGVL